VLRLVGPEDSPLRARALAWRHERTMRGMGTSPDPSALDEAVAMARRIGASRTFFTHIAHDLGHEDTCAHLPAGMALAYDGLAIDV